MCCTDLNFNFCITLNQLYTEILQKKNLLKLFIGCNEEKVGQIGKARLFI